MPRSIKTRLILGLVSVIAVILVAIFAIVGFSFGHHSHESYQRSVTGEMRQLDYAIELFLNDSLRNADMLAKSSAAGQIDEVATTHLTSTGKTSARVREGDAAGRRLVDFMKVVQDSHPAYVEVYAGNENGAFVSSLEDSTMPAAYDPRKRPWYAESRDVADRPVLGKAYLSTTGEAVTCATRAIMRGGKTVGVIGMDISLKNLTGLIKSVKLGRTGYLVLVQNDGVVLADAKHENLNFKKVSEIKPQYLNTLFGMRDGTTTVSIDGKKYMGVVLTSAATGWKLMGFMEQAEIDAPVVRVLTLLAIVGALSLLLMAFAVWQVINRSVLRPLEQVSGFVEGISKGVYDRRITHERTDEIGEIFDDLNATADTLALNIKEIRSKTDEAEGKARLAAEAKAEADEARRKAERAMSEGMLTAAGKLESIVGIVSSASSQLSAQIGEASKGADKQAQRVTETATAMEEMSATVLEVAKNASHAAETSDSARSKASDGAAVVDEAVKSIGEVERQTQVLKADMGTLGKQADGIGQIMNVISDIADQTNLLALNAAIEAARAGDAGRGFAVVADEVRKLAEKTMAATREVGEAISGIQSGTAKNIANFDHAAKAVDNATELSRKSGEALREIVGLVEGSSDQVRSIATASEEQSAASEEINHSIEQVSSIAQDTSKAMGEAAQAVDELARQAGLLQDLIKQLREEAGQGK